MVALVWYGFRRTRSWREYQENEAKRIKQDLQKQRISRGESDTPPTLAGCGAALVALASIGLFSAHLFGWITLSRRWFASLLVLFFVAGGYFGLFETGQSEQGERLKARLRAGPLATVLNFMFGSIGGVVLAGGIAALIWYLAGALAGISATTVIIILLLLILWQNAVRR